MFLEKLLLTFRYYFLLTKKIVKQRSRLGVILVCRYFKMIEVGL